MFNETSLPETKVFYSDWNTKGITEADYTHARNICNGFHIKRLGGYHELYDQGDALLLAGILIKVRNMFLKIFELDRACYLSATGSPWQAALKRPR